MSERTLAALGWTNELEAAHTTYAERGFEPARVVAEHRGGYLVRGERDERLAHARGKLRDHELEGGMPAVGDWVAVCDAPGGRAAIEAILPRRTKVSRKTPWLRSGPPESPGWSGALVSISPVSRLEPPSSSLTVIARCSPTSLPVFVLKTPAPPALPTAVTWSPTLMEFEFPTLAVVNPCAFRSISSAMSSDML